MAANLSILVVEDNDDLRQTLVDVLTMDGHHVNSVDCAEEVAELSVAFDLVILDLNLPGEDGLSLAKRLRLAQPNIGLVMLTARALSSERIAGYDSGADIYLAKPADINELRAAISALSRRLVSGRDDTALCLDLLAMQLLGLNGQQVSLTSSESTLLRAFSLAAGQRLETWQLLELLDKHEAQDPKAALELQMVRLRKKLADSGVATGSIKSVRGWGYKLCVPIRLQ